MIQNNIQTRYDSLIPTLYHQRKEYLLPIEFRQSIPHSTASTWRNQQLMHFKGSEFIHMQREGIEWYELFLETASKRGKSTIPPDTPSPRVIPYGAKRRYGIPSLWTNKFFDYGAS